MELNVTEALTSAEKTATDTAETVLKIKAKARAAEAAAKAAEKAAEQGTTLSMLRFCAKTFEEIHILWDTFEEIEPLNNDHHRMKVRSSSKRWRKRS